MLTCPGTIEMKAVLSMYSKLQNEDHDANNPSQSSALLAPRNWLEGVRLCGYVTSSVMTLNIVLSYCWWDSLYAFREFRISHTI